MKRILNIIFYILFIAIIVVGVHMYLTGKNKNQLSTSRINDLEFMLNELNQIRLMEIESENYSFTDFEVINNNNEKIKISELVNERTLLLRVFMNSCEPCIEQNLFSLDSIKSKIPVIIIVSFYNYASFTFFSKQYDLDNCYMISQNSPVVNIPMENNDLMYYVVLDKNLSGSNYHVPLKQNHVYTINYLNAINK